VCVQTHTLLVCAYTVRYGVHERGLPSSCSCLALSASAASGGCFRLALHWVQLKSPAVAGWVQLYYECVF
jgi:hypothetical protein